MTNQIDFFRPIKDSRLIRFEGFGSGSENFGPLGSGSGSGSIKTKKGSGQGLTRHALDPPHDHPYIKTLKMNTRMTLENIQLELLMDVASKYN